MAGSVYWVGGDGNIYLKAPTADGSWSVQRAGTQPASAFSLSDSGFSNGGMTINAQRIDDPNPPQPTGGGGGEAPKVLNQGGINNTQKAIDEIGGLLNDALAAEGVSYGNTTKQFGAQEEAQKKTYNEGTTTNQLNYDRNFMDSIRAGIKGLGGLMNLLRGTGAGGGTAEDLARETVGGVTAQDITAGADTQKENQSGLDTSWSTFLTDLGLKKKQAEDTFENNQRAIRRESDTQLQDLFGKMAGYYSDVDDTGNANAWLNKAGDLTSRIAANSRTKVSPYDFSPVTVKAPEITAFAGPTQPSVLAPPSDGQVGSGIFTMEPRRRRDAAAVPVGV